MDKIKCFFLIIFVFGASICQAQMDTIYQKKYEKIQTLLDAKIDSVADAQSEDLLVLLGMASVFVKDTAAEKQILADKIFSFVSQKIEQQIIQKQIDKESSQFRYINAVLQKNQYHIRVPVANSEKLIEYIKQGRFEYIFKRFINSKYVYFAAAFLVFFVVLFVFWRKKKKKT